MRSTSTTAPHCPQSSDPRVDRWTSPSSRISFANGHIHSVPPETKIHVLRDARWMQLCARYEHALLDCSRRRTVPTRACAAAAHVVRRRRAVHIGARALTARVTPAPGHACTPGHSDLTQREYTRPNKAVAAPRKAGSTEPEGMTPWCQACS